MNICCVIKEKKEQENEAFTYSILLMRQGKLDLTT